eukprot:scaffold107552_cov46-Prasinocladus_malaysianus.AAC.1
MAMPEVNCVAGKRSRIRHLVLHCLEAMAFGLDWWETALPLHQSLKQPARDCHYPAKKHNEFTHEDGKSF